MREQKVKNLTVQSLYCLLHEFHNVTCLGNSDYKILYCGAWPYLDNIFVKLRDNLDNILIKFRDNLDNMENPQLGICKLYFDAKQKKRTFLLEVICAIYMYWVYIVHLTFLH